MSSLGSGLSLLQQFVDLVCQHDGLTAQAVAEDEFEDWYQRVLFQLKFTPPDSPWRPIEYARTDKNAPSVLLGGESSLVPRYCGRWRYGTLGEPSTETIAWRCDSSGRFGHPTHFAPLPDLPEETYA